MQIAQANVLQNGSFESDYDGWAPAGNQEIVTASQGFGISDGLKAVAFNTGQNTPNGTLLQTFSTSVGQSYVLTFDAGASGFQSTAEQKMGVAVHGTNALILQNISVLGAGGSGSATIYAPQNFTFTADKTTTTLTFSDFSPTSFNIDLMLDKVAVAAQSPTPAPTPVPPHPLVVDSQNPRYFSDGNKPVFLTGSHVFFALQDFSPFPNFDYDNFLDFLNAENANFVRMWNLDESYGTLFPEPSPGYITPVPFARPGPGLAADNRPKFDLTQFDPAYFSRLHDRIAAAGARGIYVSIMLFDAFWINGNSEQFDLSPYNPANNINGLAMGINDIYTLNNPTWVAYMDA